MLRIFRAFAWLRWRMMVNAFDKTGARDRLERFSIALDQIGPLIMTLLLVPSAALFGGLGLFAGLSLARGETDHILFQLARYLLLAAPLLALVGPFFLPAADRTNPVRLLLLPIARSTLYVAQSSAAFGDLWNILAIPLILGLPLGLAIGGAILPALFSLAAALLLIATLLGLSSIAASLLHLVVRDRRRGELIALLLIVVLPLVGMVPAILATDDDRSQPVERVEDPLDPALDHLQRIGLAVIPTEMYARTLTAVTQRDRARAIRSSTTLAVFTVAVHLLGFVAFRKVLGSPASSGGKRGAPMHGLWTRRVPGLSRPASAVALAQLRLALRTPRGRSIMLSPLVVFFLFGAMMYRNPGEVDLGPFHFTSGIGLATVCSFFATLSVLPIAMNQFAVDRAGLTLALLSPLGARELLAGKAVGNALIVGPPALLCMMVSGLVFPGDPPSLWIALFLGITAMYLVTAPIAAIASAMFPRVANLNSIGRGGNPHGLANFIGMVTMMAGGGIPLLLSLAATNLLGRPILAPLFVAIWCAIAYVGARMIFVLAVRIFQSRRENLALLE